MQGKERTCRCHEQATDPAGSAAAAAGSVLRQAVPHSSRKCCPATICLSVLINALARLCCSQLHTLLRTHNTGHLWRVKASLRVHRASTTVQLLAQGNVDDTRARRDDNLAIGTGWCTASPEPRSCRRVCDEPDRMTLLRAHEPPCTWRLQSCPCR
jgi:hypothetical protein